MTDNQDSVTAGAAQPPTDRPLTTGDVPLLRKGDLIKGPNGKTYRFEEWGDGGFLTFIDEPYDGFLATLCTFVSRPASEGVDSSHGSVYDRLLTLIHDRDEALRGDGQTDPSEIDETVLEIMKITNALASPPVSERERELEGALRNLVAHTDGLTLPATAQIMRERARALTTQPAGEGK